MKFLKIIVTYFLIIFVTGIIAAVLGEIYVRFFSEYGRMTPVLSRERSLEYEPALFCRHIFPEKEKFVSECITKDYKEAPKYHINARGYRGKDFSPEKPLGTIRVIIYGGSSVFDTRTQVDEGGSWPEKVQNILRQNGYPEVEVINAGIPGHASFDSLGRLFARDHRYGPDYVVLYNGWNDIKYFHSSRPLIHQFKPFQKGRDPRLSYQNWLDKILCRYSQLYERLRSRYYNWKLNLGKEGIKPRGDVGSIITEKSLEQFQLNLEMFLDLARNINAVPILMTQARLITPDNSESDKEKIGYGMVLLDHQSLCKAFSEVDRIIKVVAKEKDAAVIDPTDELNGNSDYFTDHVHLTPKGSGRLAELVAADLARIIVNTKKDDHSGGL